MAVSRSTSLVETRALEEIGPDQRERVATARAKIRRQVWKLIEARHGQIPASRVADVDLGPTIVIRMDATIQIARSDKEQATGTFRSTYGYHRLTVWCDNTGESLAFLLRPGKPGRTEHRQRSHHGADRGYRADPGPEAAQLLVTVDGASATLDLINHITGLNAVAGHRVHYSVGFDLDRRGRAAISQVPEQA